MAKKNSPRININLSSKGKQTVGKVVYGWTIDAGRAIIVGIELIALVALGYRFVIDRQIVDLHDQIKIEEVYIAAQASDERTYKEIHEKLKSIKETNTETEAKVELMNEILQAISGGTLFATNLTINEQSILIDGSTFSIFTLTEFLEGLKLSPNISSISIDEVTTADEGVRFKSRIELKSTITNKET